MTGPTVAKTAPPLKELPPALAGASLPDVLLGYQRRLLAESNAPLVVCEKSRRIGVTWGIGADAVLTASASKAAGGMDVFYIGFNRDMTREFIDTCAMWARAFASVAAQVEEFVFEDGADRDIQAFRIKFGSDFQIVALCSRPRSLRGRQGYVIIDEAAFHDDLPELLKAAMALLIWGGRVLVISTHDGADNAFNELVSEIRAGKRKKAKLLRITFDDALADGLFERVCLVSGKEPTPAYRAEWTADIRDHYGDDAGEELDVIPKQSGGRFLARTLLEARSNDVKVIRWELPASFVDLPEEERTRIADEFCRDEIRPLLDAASGAAHSYVGQDFGRSGDLSVMWPLLVAADLKRSTPFVIEMRNIPFTTQQHVLWFVIDALPRFGGVALDATGNGAYLAEVTRQRYSPDSVSEVKLSEAWYREHMSPMKSLLEDAALDIPNDADIVDDFRSLEVVRGVARVPERSTKGRDGKQRHGDTAIACALAVFASRTLDAGPIFGTAQGSLVSLGAFTGDLIEHRNLAGWND